MARHDPAPPLQFWGGHECTVNRVGESFRDQTVLSGHQHRPEDLEQFATLGIAKLRYPVLWERVAPDRPGDQDWTWSDDRLARIRRLGIEPIVGLLHHGSGPRYTSLVDPAFPALLGEFAGAVAARYPDVVDWTPVNEPLTTARFSALYGLWYPHAQDERSFWQALLNQIDGTRAAMGAIRAVNPAARLIQTEDLGRCYSTPALAGIAEHHNHRRWLTWDLLAGRVGRDHPLWDKAEQLGLSDRLRAIADDPCPAEILGLNHYITSDRFLDDRAEAHQTPLPPIGYHDVTAARVLQPPPPGLSGVVTEAWNRYGTPIAITESHLGCTREEQLRWLAQSWRDCQTLRTDGVDVRALTAWALIGSMDWNSLLTQAADHYEPGAFDIRAGVPRRTAIGTLFASLAHAGRTTPAIDAALARPGWWRRDTRLEHLPHALGGTSPVPVSGPDRTRPLLITGATGTLGQAIARACEKRDLSFVLTSRKDLSLDDPIEVAAALDRHRPWAVINAAGWVRVDEAEDEPAACMDANAATHLSRACAERGLHCTLFSSDLVFDGAHGPHHEADRPAPLGAYARSKAAMEHAAIATGGPVLVIRTAAFFSADDPYNFAAAVTRELRAGRRFRASPEHLVTPTYVPDLVQACLDLVIDGAKDIWHLTNGEALSWHSLAGRIAAASGLDASLIEVADAGVLGWRAPRSRNGALLSTRGALLPSLDNAIARFAAAARPTDDIASPMPMPLTIG